MQNPDRFVSRRADWKVVTEAQPPGDQWDDIDMVWTVCAYAKSNAVILVKDGVTWDIGAGQQNRRDSVRLAGEKAAGRAAGGVYAGDAFFPFSDGLDGVISAGATGDPARRLDGRPEGHRQGRRSRPGHDLYRRTPHPALSDS